MNVNTERISTQKEAAIHLTGFHSHKDKNAFIPGKVTVICGWCGSVEQYVSSTKTECSHCDDYLY